MPPLIRSWAAADLLKVLGSCVPRLPFPRCRGRIARRRPYGFTLIELLAVLVIVAVLATLTVPVFAKSIQKGKSTQSLSNLKTITAAYLSYAADNNGRYPATGGYVGGAWGKFWPHLLLEGGYLQIPSQDVYFNNRDKHPRTGVLWSPSEAKDMHHGIADYGPSDNVVPHSKEVPPVVKVQNPSKTVLVGDSRRAVGAKFGGSWWLKAADFIANPQSSGAAGKPTPSRHGGSVHLGFADGHVEQLAEVVVIEQRKVLFTGPYDISNP